MVYTKKLSVRKPAIRRRRKVSYKKRPTNAISTSSRGVSFKRTFFTSIWDFNPASLDGFWRAFAPKFTDLPNHQEYIALFDQFKMTGIKVTFHPRYTGVVNFTNSPATVNNNQMYLTYGNTSRDWDYAPLGTYTSATYNKCLEEVGNVKTIQLIKPVSVYFKPTVFEDTGLYGFKVSKAPWMSLNHAGDARFHGMSAFMHDYNFGALDTTPFGLDVQFTYYFQCRGQA